MIREREKVAVIQPGVGPTWEFVFLAANQDAMTEGGQMGFAPARSVDFDANAGGVHAAMSLMHEKIARKRRWTPWPAWTSTRPTARGPAGRRARRTLTNAERRTPKGEGRRPEGRRDKASRPGPGRLRRIARSCCRRSRAGPRPRSPPRQSGSRPANRGDAPTRCRGAPRVRPLALPTGTGSPTTCIARFLWPSVSGPQRNSAHAIALIITGRPCSSHSSRDVASAFSGHTERTRKLVSRWTGVVTGRLRESSRHPAPRGCRRPSLPRVRARGPWTPAVA